MKYKGMKIAVVVGTRPDIIKSAPVIKEIQKRKNLELFIINTGQHYDENMSDNFITELGLPIPNIQLEFPSKDASQIETICHIMETIEYILESEKPDILVVTGDTNSALASALAASKLRIPIGHIEAGCRTYDKTQTEEINRILVDHMSSMLFAPTPYCANNMVRESLENSSKVYITGHPIVDLLHEIKIPEIKYSKGEYAFMTFHRRENITDKSILENILHNISRVEHENHIPIIFSIHPHTRKQITEFGLEKYLENFWIINPVGYIDSLSFIKHAKFVITDSGGIIQEAAILGTPCVSIINVTGWVETVQAGVNFLVGSNIHEKIYDIVFKIMNGHIKRKQTNLFGKVGVSKRIVDILEG